MEDPGTEVVNSFRPFLILSKWGQQYHHTTPPSTMLSFRVLTMFGLEEPEPWDFGEVWNSPKSHGLKKKQKLLNNQVQLWNFHAYWNLGLLSFWLIQVGALEFPNRRFFGNRADEFVRARRAQLEVRNSNVVHLLLTTLDGNAVDFSWWRLKGSRLL